MAAARRPELVQFAGRGARAAGFTHAVLCGMGGSSLAPDALRRSLGVRRGFLDLAVLDSTDPAAVLAAAAAQRSGTARSYLFSSKSGTYRRDAGVLFAFFWDRVRQHLVGERAGEHFVAITDTGTASTARA